MRPVHARLVPVAPAHLKPGGILALNGLSPDQTPAAYWCVYQTLRSVGLAALPGRSRVPSFAELGYGEWGFFLASDRAITPVEVCSLPLPPGVRTLDGPKLVDCFAFPRQQADQRMTVRPASDEGRTLYEYLLDATAIGPIVDEETVCFLGFDDPFPPFEPVNASVPSLKLKGWLDRQPGTGIDDLLRRVPLGNRIVTRELVMEWAKHLMQVASNLDLRRLISALIRRSDALPKRLVADLKRFRKFLSRGEDPVANFETWGWRFFSILMLVLVLAQTAMPTAVYAKGFGGGVSHSGGGSYYGGGGAYYSGGGTYYGSGGTYSSGDGTYYGGTTYVPGSYSTYPSGGYPVTQPAAPPLQQPSGYVSGSSGYVSGGAAPAASPYTYYYSDSYYDYYYCYANGRYYYYSKPR